MTLQFLKAAGWVTIAAFFLPLMASPAIVHVAIENIKFNPEVLTVKKGDTVIWKNKDLVPHTVTAEGAAKPEFDSGQINPEGEFQQKIKKSGEFRYKCRLHPTMKAKLISN